MPGSWIGTKVSQLQASDVGGLRSDLEMEDQAVMGTLIGTDPLGQLAVFALTPSLRDQMHPSNRMGMGMPHDHIQQPPQGESIRMLHQRRYCRLPLMITRHHQVKGGISNVLGHRRVKRQPLPGVMQETELSSLLTDFAAMHDHAFMAPKTQFEFIQAGKNTGPVNLSTTQHNGEQQQREVGVDWLHRVVTALVQKGQEHLIRWPISSGGIFSLHVGWMNLGPANFNRVPIAFST